MLILSQTTQFKRDIKKKLKQGKSINDIDFVIKILRNKKSLPVKYKNHNLIGNWKGCQECHIKPDWLFIYRIIDDKELRLERTGSHSDLF